MKKEILIAFFSFFMSIASYCQYAPAGSGVLKDKIWWFDWAGFTISNGASKSFVTDDGLSVTISISNAVNPVLVPSIMNTWSGAVLHLLYNFPNAAIKPALFRSEASGGVSNIQFTMNIAATRNGLPTPFTFIAADAEASTFQETSVFTTNGSSWTTLEFFRNSSQTSNPLSGCGTSSVRLNSTYGGSAATGQNPILATTSPNGQLTINTSLENLVSGGMAVAFGIFSAVDRGDLPVSYGAAVHRILLNSINGCNYSTPFPSIEEENKLYLGAVPPDADNVQSNDDNGTGTDEDAIYDFPIYDKSGAYTLHVPVANVTGNDAYLTGWFDYDRNGTFGNNESVNVIIPANSTIAKLTWTGLPANLPSGKVPEFGFRLRLSSNEQETKSSTGPAQDGEVEDYQVQIYPAVAAFTAPDTVCINSPVTITNTSTDATSFLWTFCVADLKSSVPTGSDLGNLGNQLVMPVYMDYVYHNGNYYAFVVNHFPAGLLRLNFGNSLLNTPTTTNLGNPGNVLNSTPQGIQVIEENGKWYAFVVGGDNRVGHTSHITKLEFGTNPANTPTGTDWGNTGNLKYPHDLFMFKEGTSWFGFTVNYTGNSVTRFNFGHDFSSVPTATEFSTFGGLSGPTGICPINDNGTWRIFVTNYDNHSLSRIDFGNSLLNAPTGGLNMGNPGNLLHNPRDLYIFKACDQTVGFIINDHTTTDVLSRLNFSSLLAIPTITSLPNIGGTNTPHSISRIFREGSDFHAFLPNTYINTISRITFKGNCSGVNTSTSSLATPPLISYSSPGTYNINLTVNEGLPNQTSYCKEIIVRSSIPADFSFLQDICNPQSIKFKNESTGHQSVSWDFGNTITSVEEMPTISFNTYATYAVKLKTIASGGCADSIVKRIPVLLSKDSIIITRDTSYCYNNAPFTLNSRKALDYCWMPLPGLSATNIGSPSITGVIPKTTYYLNALMTGNNLITNGDFSQGNTGFTSEYTYAGVNTTEGQYYAGPSPISWNPQLSRCVDHTSGNGNMLLVNGNPVSNATVWKASVTVTPNTNYAFTTWIQALHSTNPAQLQFSISDKNIGELITASLPTCSWTQFYTVWNSGNNTTATISIVNKNTQVQGNDFSLDDISFAELKMVRDSVTVAINANPNVDFNYNIPFCKSVQMTGVEIDAPNAIANWKWNFGDNLSASASTLTHNYKTGGKYTIKLVATDVNSCKDSTEKEIQLDTIMAVISADTTVCKDAIISLKGSGGTIYEWSPSSMSIANVPEPAVAVSQTTRFHLKVKNGIGCEDTDSVLVSVKPRPAFKRPPDRTVCADSSIQLMGNNGSAYKYLWSPSLTIDDPASINPMASPSGNSLYQVTITEDPCGYDTTFSIMVTVNPNPVVTVTKQRDIDCINPTTSLIAEGTGSRYEWSPASGVDYPKSSRVIGSVDSTTTFIIKNTNQYNCSAYDSVIVKVTNTAKPVFILPNAFSPNRDGVNDCFGIKHWGNVVIHEFSVFNRWGERVFTTKNPRDCWDGMYKGQPAPSGGYVYTVRATSFCGEMVRKGSLILVR